MPLLFSFPPFMFLWLDLHDVLAGIMDSINRERPVTLVASHLLEHLK